MVYGIQFWIECKGGLKTANELSDVLDDLVYDGNLSLAYSNHSIMGAGLFMKNAVQNNFESIREILNEFADKIKYVSEWDYEDSSDMKWGVHTLGESKKSARKSIVDKTKIKHPKAEIIKLDETKSVYYPYYEVEGLYFFNFDVGETCSIDLKDAFNADGVISEFYKNENKIYSIVVCSAIDYCFFISYDYRKKKVIHSECFSSYQNAKNAMRDWLKNI